MKYSAALALVATPLVLAKAVHNVYPLPMMQRGEKKGEAKGKSKQVVAGHTTEVIVIWVNAGAGAATSTINQQVTVTQTVTAGAGGVAETNVAGGVAAPAATHSVEVGGAAGLQFSPPEIKAAQGDMVVFTFKNANHTATQSAFDTPCDPLANGMDSGFQANPNNTISPAPQVAMQVMVTTPLWFYCRQKGHCGKGMVFSINPTAEKTHALFQSLAIQQKGTGTGSAITGNATAPTGGEAATTSSVAVVEGAATSTVETTATAIATGTGAVATGVGSFDPTTGVCTCAVAIGAGAFPAVQAQGLGSFGGFSGGLPAAMMERSS